MGTRKLLSSSLSRFFRAFVEGLLFAAKGFFRDDGPSWAAAIAYYSLLSLLPLLLALGWIASFFVDPLWVVSKAAPYLSGYLPNGRAQIEATVSDALAVAHDSGWLFLFPLLWTGTLVFGALARGLNASFRGERRVGLLKRIVVRLAMLVTLGVLFTIALTAPVLGRLIGAQLDRAVAGGGWFIDKLLDLLPAALLLLALLLVYRFVLRSRPGWRAAGIGAIVATGLFYVARPIFLGYVDDIARYNLVYGSLAGVVAAILWTWIFAIIMLFGGQIASHCSAGEGRCPVARSKRSN